MPSKQTIWRAYGTVGTTVVQTASRVNNSTWTVKNGRVVIATNPHSLRQGGLVHASVIDPNRPASSPLTGDVSSSDGPLGDFDVTGFQASLANKAVEKFNKRIRGGTSASLGLTVVQWRQSASMLTSRLNKTVNHLDGVIKRLDNPRNFMRARQRVRHGMSNPLGPPANAFLEGEFGWLPLMNDISAALGLATAPLPFGYVSGSSRGVTTRRRVSGVKPTIYSDHEVTCRATYAARVEVSNHNLWLANYLGLVNIPYIAFDAVPWSFLVNFFSNTGQMISSLTDEVGLKVSDRSLTQTRWCTRTRSFSTDSSSNIGSYRSFGKEKVRTLVSSAPLTWRAHVPDISWESAAILGSLAVQQFTRIGRMLL